MQYTIFDIETDGLLSTVTKIHCLSYKTFIDGEEIDKGSLINYDEIKDFVLSQDVLVGHNIIRYDIPVLEKLLGIEIKSILIDTLALSWYLYPLKKKHGLEQWGEDLGVEKPYISDWNNLSVQDYIHRCETDVVINSLLFERLFQYLKVLYEYNQEKIFNLINYLVFKLDCAREQEQVKCKIDVELINSSLEELRILKEEKILSLSQAMPRDIKYKAVSKPSKLYKKDGSLTVQGEKWYNLLDIANLDYSYEGTINIEISNEPGNPGSSTQLKNWLFQLGWVPRNFAYVKNKEGEINEVPQIYVNDEVCSSIKELYDIEPALENLDMLSLINHRISIFESFLDSKDSNDFVTAEVKGFTNTLRFKHAKPIVNLPKVFKFYGQNIRGAIIRPSVEHLLCGSDMSSLEDTTKQHYMYFFDPDYVIQMRTPGFDPHLDIAVLANMLTAEQAEQHKLYSRTKGVEGIDFSQVRNKSKVVNFAAVYGAGPPKIAQSTGMPLEQARKLHKTYWERNKAVKLVANSCKTKTVEYLGETQMWLLNPVSGFWYSLRFEKDKFSTLNQGTGVFCFDLWVREVRKRGIKIMLQYHDEIAFPLKEHDKNWVEHALQEAIESVNNIVKLNVPLGISIDFGENYAKIH